MLGSLLRAWEVLEHHKAEISSQLSRLSPGSRGELWKGRGGNGIFAEIAFFGVGSGLSGRRWASRAIQDFWSPMVQFRCTEMRAFFWPFWPLFAFFCLFWPFVAKKNLIKGLSNPMFHYDNSKRSARFLMEGVKVSHRCVSPYHPIAIQRSALA